ncbi:U3 small nucleolar RNA-associated protein 6-like [Holothuria leucospilota]|uniref:U3 small nucleolar RNA-associated protein 6-like n=1 Tax=Holothuria leucospilota TaxID=206669 RepID=A0A9Q1C6V1_HOLLE|nr:U3 small nucleolar RNA-associated protein 6-like [Holothuria leucospilota]
MWSLFITFCYERLQLKESRDISDKRVAHLLKLFERASSQFTLSEEDFLKWGNVLIHTGQLEEASRVGEKATTAHSQSAKLWEMRIQQAARIASKPDEKDKEHVRRLFDSAISSVKSKNALNIWMIGLEWCLLYDEDRVTALFEAGCEEHRNVSLPLKECYLEYAATTGGIKKARKVYKKLQIKKPLSVEFYKKKILLENTQPQVNVTKLRETYEDALKEFGSHDPDLWLDYIKMESSLQQMPSLENVKKLHWRAKSALEGMYVEQFISGYTLLQLSQ